MKKVGSTNNTLKHLLLEAIIKKLDKKKAQFNCFNRFILWGFGNIQYQNFGKT